MARLICEDCGERYEDYEVHDEVWQLVAELDDESGPENVCIKCFERDLHEKVRPQDFTANEVNKEYVRSCDNCEARFRPNHFMQWYCSRACGDAWSWVAKRECDFCHGRFVPKRKNQRYCSADHAYQGRRSDVMEKTCEHCGEQFDTFSKRQKYCSLSCGAASKRAPVEERECPVCHDKFTATSKRQKYCGKEECRREGFNRHRRQDRTEEHKLFKEFMKWHEQRSDDCV